MLKRAYGSDSYAGGYKSRIWEIANTSGQTWDYVSSIKTTDTHVYHYIIAMMEDIHGLPKTPKQKTQAITTGDQANKGKSKGPSLPEGTKGKGGKGKGKGKNQSKSKPQLPAVTDEAASMAAPSHPSVPKAVNAPKAPPDGPKKRPNSVARTLHPLAVIAARIVCFYIRIVRWQRNHCLQILRMCKDSGHNCKQRNSNVSKSQLFSKTWSDPADSEGQKTPQKRQTKCKNAKFSKSSKVNV